MLCFCWQTLHGQTLLIRGGTLIDGTGNAPISNVDILVRDGIVAEIRSGPMQPIANGAEVLQAQGKFIIPGLIDSHVHYRDWKAELFLVHGVTTVYDLGNPYQWQTALKKGFNTGRMRGPRYFYCGEIELPSEESQRPSIERRGLDIIRKPEDALPIVQRLKQNGADCIKLSESFNGETFTAIARAADAEGLNVISHSMNAADSVRWGIDGIEHMVGIAVATAQSPKAKQAVAGLRLEAGHKNSSLYQWMEPAEYDRLIHELVSRGVYVNPTLAFEWKALHERSREHELEDQRLFSLPELGYVPLDDRLVILGQYHWADARSPEEIRQFKDGYRKVQQFLAAFVRAGGKIYSGTDTSAATSPGLSLHHEMELLVDAGLTPMQAIMTATKNSADLLALSGKIGTVEKGKLADMVVLDANPLENIQNTKKIYRVIKDGRIVDTKYHADYEIPIKRPGIESKHLYNPTPTLQDVVPPIAIENSNATLRVRGRGFTQSSVVQLEGRTIETRFVSPAELTAILTPETTARVGTFRITVVTPKPGGGTSDPIEFMITFK